jgi:hypothetical protein
MSCFVKHQTKMQIDEPFPKREARDEIRIREALNQIDWKAITARVIQEVSEQADHYEQARARSLERAAQHVLP